MIKKYTDFIEESRKEAKEAQNESIINVEYVSVWDGDEERRTEAKYDTKKKLVFDIEMADDVEGLDILDREYIELPGGDTINIYPENDGVKVEGRDEN